MSNVAIVYWSGTGNTEAMANAISEGAKGAGAKVDMFTASEFDASKVSDYSAIAFGCPSMGAEQLEDMEFEPMWEGVKNELNGVKVFLFGSYGWGDGEWMRTWESTAPCNVLETYICNETPGEAEVAACNAMGAKMA